MCDSLATWANWLHVRVRGLGCDKLLSTGQVFYNYSNISKWREHELDLKTHARCSPINNAGLHKIFYFLGP